MRLFLVKKKPIYNNINYILQKKGTKSRCRSSLVSLLKKKKKEEKESQRAKDDAAVGGA